MMKKLQKYRLFFDDDIEVERDRGASSEFPLGISF
jgi:hypothetical protein